MSPGHEREARPRLAALPGSPIEVADPGQEVHPWTLSGKSMVRQDDASCTDPGISTPNDNFPHTRNAKLLTHIETPICVN